MQLGNIFNTSRPNGSMLQQFADFKKKMEGKDCETIVKQMLKDGQMTQQQFDTFRKQAESLMAILR